MIDQIFFKRVFVLLLLPLVPVFLRAYDFEVNGIYYNINFDIKSVEVTYKSEEYNSYSGGIQIPSSVTNGSNTYNVVKIAKNAFRNCAGITSITIPGNVTSIDPQAFYGCSGLMAISVDQDNAVYDSRNNCNAIIETSSNTLILGCKNTVISSDVISIGPSAFRNCSRLKSIEIPEGVTSIGASAFNNCYNLTTIVIPEGVTSIGASAFSNCVNLKSITIPVSVTTIGNSAFSGCWGLTSVNIPNSVTIIGIDAFKACGNLTSVTIPSSVTTIGEGAFADCKGLIKAEFSSIESLCNITFDGSYSNPLYYVKHLYINGEEVKDVVIPEGVTSIGSYTFGYCSELTSIFVPKSVARVGESPFIKCGKLKSIIVDADNNVYDSRNNCNAIVETSSNTLVAGCKKTIIPKSVTSIGQGAFRDCKGLTSITIPESVSSIGSGAFDGCENLKVVKCLAKRPPVTGSASFPWIRDSNLYVPTTSINFYRSVSPWKFFGQILPR